MHLMDIVVVAFLCLCVLCMLAGMLILQISIFLPALVLVLTCHFLCGALGGL